MKATCWRCSLADTTSVLLRYSLADTLQRVVALQFGGYH